MVIARTEFSFLVTRKLVGKATTTTSVSEATTFDRDWKGGMNKMVNKGMKFEGLQVFLFEIKLRLKLTLMVCLRVRVL